MKRKIEQFVERNYGNHPIFYSLHDYGLALKHAVGRSHKINHKEHFNPFFIIGSGRSGNTLFRTMLTQKEEIVIPPESFVLGKAIRKYKMTRHMEWEDICGLFISFFERHHGFPRWGIDAREFYQEAIKIEKQNRNLEYLIHSFFSFYGKKKKPSFTRWGDKTPINTFSLKLLDQVFPDSQFIHMIRDGRDVVSSYLDAGLYDNASKASERWMNSIHTAKLFGDKVGKDRYFEVYYEDLVNKPEETLQGVCNFLNISFEPSMLNHFQGIEGLGDTKLPHHKNLAKPVNKSSIGKWKQRLTEEQQTIVTEKCKPTLHQLGYLD
ncbi:Sulfotransferase family protein [Thalassobacillus cyri]|uniref:Sulfotransferase family protein n=1 Tax=Thalassobacillus cyri TaxID=571932 RepID=A0A1H4DWA1_9BACI|nr:sulfotransferase [Thalassobacillus cyri]SEA76877.1 Sulfotransferase family protein [Thalassobacillus cyri]